MHSGLNLKTLIVGSILTAIVAFVAGGNGEVYQMFYWRTIAVGRINYPYWVPRVGVFLYAMGFATLIVLLLAIVNQIKPVFNRQEVTILVIMVFTAGFLNGVYQMSDVLNHLLGIGKGSFFPSNPIPEEDIALIERYASPVLTGVMDKSYWQYTHTHWWAPIDFSKFITPMSWGIAFIICLTLFVAFVMLLFRRLYINMEFLPFPIAEVQGEMVELTQKTEKGKVGFFGNRWFILGFAIQFVWLTPLLINALYNSISLGGGDRYWWWYSGCPEGILAVPLYDFTPNAILPWVPLLVLLDPWMVGWNLILSMDVLVGAFIGLLIVWFLLPLLMTGAAIWPPMDTGLRGHIPAARVWMDYTQQGGTLGVVTLNMGMLLGFAVIPVVRNWGTMKHILLGLFKEPPQSVDPDRPISYRLAWIGMILFGVLSLALVSAINVNPLPYLVLMVLLAIFTVGGTRFVAETGGFYGHWTDIGYNHVHAIIPLLESVVVFGVFKYLLVEELTMTIAMTFIFIVARYAIVMLSSFFVNIGTITLASFKLSSISSTRSKDTLKTIVYAMVVSAIVLSFAVFIWPHILPGDAWNNYQRWAAAEFPLAIDLYPQPHWDYVQASGLMLDPFAGPGAGPYETTARIVVGFVVVLLITLLRDRLPWFRVSAAGILLGTFAGVWLWAPITVALVTKFIVLRVGGTKLYNDKVKPLAVGLCLGGFLAWILYAGFGMIGIYWFTVYNPYIPP